MCWPLLEGRNKGEGQARKEFEFEEYETEKEAETINATNILHGPEIMRLAKRHRMMASKRNESATRCFPRIAREGHGYTQRGLKHLSRRIRHKEGKHMMVANRDDGCAHGGQVGATTCGPEQIAGSVNRALQKIYEGNVKTYS